MWFFYYLRLKYCLCLKSNKYLYSLLSLKSFKSALTNEHKQSFKAVMVKSCMSCHDTVIKAIKIKTMSNIKVLNLHFKSLFSVVVSLILIYLCLL